MQGNFTEYAPLALIGLFAMAGLSANPYWLHGAGGAFTLGRIMHAVGFSGNSGISFGRFAGMILTWGSMLVMAVYLLYQVVT
ncbi:MAG: MAPEG family protein [Robiginitomaculum sp.]|nr:MAPEG family protein [Robiginitomaculum sp.]